LRLLGALRRSNVAAGVAPGLDRKFGTMDDVVETQQGISTIQRLITHRVVGSSNANDRFGIVAADRVPLVLEHGRRYLGRGNVMVLQPVAMPSESNPPTISAALANDTAPAGATNFDRITSDPTIRGTVVDSSGIVGFHAGFDSTPQSSFFDIRSSLAANGQFTLTPALLNRINKGQLTDGAHTLHLRSRDMFGNTSSIFDFTFEFDTTAP